MTYDDWKCDGRDNYWVHEEGDAEDDGQDWRCPHCGTYDLERVTDLRGLPWLVCEDCCWSVDLDAYWAQR